MARTLDQVRRYRRQFVRAFFASTTVLLVCIVWLLFDDPESSTYDFVIIVGAAALLISLISLIGSAFTTLVTWTKEHTDQCTK